MTFRIVMHRNMHIKHTQHITQIVKKNNCSILPTSCAKSCLCSSGPDFALMKLAFKHSVFDKATSIC